MKIINVCYDDYANFSFNNAKALQSVGIDCKSYKLVKHPFNYKEESEVVTRAQMATLIASADLIQIMHTDEFALGVCRSYSKRCVVYHTGTKYRANPKENNEFFNPFVERCFTDQTEFIGLGMKNETYIASAIDTDTLKPGSEIGSTITYAHYPSNPVVKGTMQIIEKMDSCLSPGMRFVFDVKRVDAEENLQRMLDCDVYIELFAPKQGEKEYGCYGVTAFEAASMGKLVITQNLHPEVYKKFYGGQEMFYLITDFNTLPKIVEQIQTTNLNLLRTQQKCMREWIVLNHSYKATGDRLVNILKLK